MSPRLGIYEALEGLRPKHRNLGISKIRLLEQRGLISVELGEDGRRLYDPDEISAALPHPDF